MSAVEGNTTWPGSWEAVHLPTITSLQLLNAVRVSARDPHVCPVKGYVGRTVPDGKATEVESITRAQLGHTAVTVVGYPDVQAVEEHAVRCGTCSEGSPVSPITCSQF